MPLTERIAAIRVRKAGERQRAQLNAARKTQRGAGQVGQRHVAAVSGKRLDRERQGSVPDTPPAAGAHLGSHLGPSSRPGRESAAERAATAGRRPRDLASDGGCASYPVSRNHQLSTFFAVGVSLVRRQASAAFFSTSPWVG